MEKVFPSTKAEEGLDRQLKGHGNTEQGDETSKKSR